MKTRIILADDHAMFRHGLSELLQSKDNLEIVGQAHDGHSTLELARELSPDIVIMDIGMPDLNGIDATREIVNDLPNTQVIALSMHSGSTFVIEMLRAGAKGYLLKDCAFEELITAIEVVTSGKRYLSPSISDVVVDTCVANPESSQSSVFSMLSPREREVLQLMTEGKTTKQIGLALHISPKTVEGHRLRLMEKLQIDNIAQLTKYAIQEGLTSPEP